MDNQNQTPVTSIVTPQVVVEQPKTSNFLIILLSILLFISVVIAGFFAYQTQRLVSELKIKNEELIVKTSEPTVEPVATNSAIATADPTANWKTYTDDKYKFSLRYPNGVKNHVVSVSVLRVTGFGYCYLYGTEKTIVISGINAKTADGVGTGDTEICDQPRDVMSKKGNTFVLIPLAVSNDGLPVDQIFINYDYPLSDLNLAKQNLDQVLSTFKFTDAK